MLINRVRQNKNQTKYALEGGPAHVGHYEWVGSSLHMRRGNGPSKHRQQGRIAHHCSYTPPQRSFRSIVVAGCRPTPPRHSSGMMVMIEEQRTQEPAAATPTAAGSQIITGVAGGAILQKLMDDCCAWLVVVAVVVAEDEEL